jgi:threonine-phosphate decarboxylase
VWGLAGVRAGYLLGSCDLVARLEAARQPWPVNSVALAAIEICAPDRQTPARVASEVAAERALLVSALAALEGVDVWPSDANFLLLRCVRRPPSPCTCAARDLAVRPAADFPGLGEDFIRIAVRHRADNERLVEAIATAVARC